MVLAAPGVQPHERDVRLLMRRLARYHSAERVDRRLRLATGLVQLRQLKQQVNVELAERLSPLGGPILVAVLG
jgi:hypothetical protein